MQKNIWKLAIFAACVMFYGGVINAAEKPVPITPADAECLKNPVMKWSPASDPENAFGLKQPFAKDPSVVRFGERYLMYFSLPPEKGNDFGWYVGVAESTDLTHWKLVGTVTPLTEHDKKGLAAPCAKVWDGRVHLFYQSYGNGPKDAMMYAVSEDGIKFTPHEKNPIFSPTGAWNNGRAIDADFFEFNGKCFLYAATRCPEGKIQKLVVATAESRDHLGAGAWTQACDASILEPELPWETQCIEAPTVMERDGKLFMFYAGGYNNHPQQVGVAVSEDGLKWKRLWDVPFIPNGPPGQWNSSETGHPGVFEDENGRTWLFFQGNDTRGKNWFLSRVEIGWKDGKPFVVEDLVR